MFAAATVLMFGGGCASRLGEARPEHELIASEEFEMIEGIALPDSPGPEGCGSQALGAVIAFYQGGGLAAAREVASDLPWRDEGATPIELLLESRRRGFPAQALVGSLDVLAGAIDARTPPIVMLDAHAVVTSPIGRREGPSVMHWMVVSGLATDRGAVTLAAPGGDEHYLVPSDEFDRRWRLSDRCVILLARPVQPAD